MKTKWEVKNLGEVCDKASSNVSQNQLDNESGKYPIFGASGLIKNVSFFHQNKAYISIVKDGAGIGRITLQPAYSSIIGTLQYLIPKKEIDISYLYYFLLGIDFNKHRNGATIPHIYFKDYSQEKISVPPLSIQKQIVAILDKSFEEISKAKENAEKNLKNVKELFDSYLQSIFENKGEGWEEKTLNHVCENICAGGDVPKDNFSETKTEKYFIPIFSNGEKNEGLYGYTNLKKITKASITISARGTIGYSLKREEAFFPIIRLIVLTPDLKIVNLNFLDYAVKNINFKSKGTSIPQLTVPMVKEYLINFPKSLPEQQSIVSKLDTLSNQTKKLEAIYQHKLNDLEELKKAILQKAFNGELIKE